jgi:hypothetical protein
MRARPFGPGRRVTMRCAREADVAGVSDAALRQIFSSWVPVVWRAVRRAWCSFSFVATRVMVRTLK